jgi:hypothetical protein
MTLAQAQEHPNVLQTVSLLTAYCFDLRGLAPTQIINEWLGSFSALWIRLAVIEALYLGRYKAISVEHLLQSWDVRGQPNLHFSAEFEQMVSQRLPKSLSPSTITLDGDRRLGSSTDRDKTLNIPAFIHPVNSLTHQAQENLSSAKVSHTITADPLDSPNIEIVLQTRKPVVTSPGVGVKPTRLASPSIAQFMPIAVESDLLSKLQSVLNQSSLAVRG